MGGSSTSHSAVLRDGATQKPDLRSWQGLTEVLRTAKEALKDPRAYGEFRNLVLEYAQKGGDAELRARIDGMIASFARAATADATPSPFVGELKREPEPAHEKPRERRDEQSQGLEKGEKKDMGSAPIGTRRIEPRFSSPRRDPIGAPLKEEAALHTETAIPVQVADVAFTPPIMPTPSLPAVEEPTPHASEVRNEVREESPNETPREAATEAVVVKEIVREVITPPVPAGFRTLDEHKARIAEIKRAVNGQVGNPATLIDTHNDLGKKYMKALLSALKATGGGGENVDAAMAELEVAAEALLAEDRMEGDTVEEKEPPREITVNVPATENTQAPHEDTPGTAPSEETETQAVPEQPVAADEPVPEDVSQTPPQPMPMEEEAPLAEMPEPPLPVAEPALPDISPPPPVIDIPAPPPMPSSARERAIAATDEKIISVIKEIEKQRPEGKDRLTSLLIHETPREPERRTDLPPPQEVHAPRDPGFWPPNRHVVRGIAKRPIEDIKKESGIDPSDVIIKQTELSSPEVTEALHQLLNEWTIFRGKGFFGTGPSGQHHPLYATLAPLSMGEVIAGRWEGSDRKLTKLIKQYVDAWRHEQGIAYGITETFEHYLRRVVQRILKRQQTR